MRDDFAIFILSHGRAHTTVTVNTLKNTNYNGKWYIILDNEDNQIEEYKARFGAEHCYVFDRIAQSQNINFDIGDNFTNRNTIVFARNMCFEIAKDLGLNWFLEFEDDYVEFKHRNLKPDGSMAGYVLQDWDAIVNELICFMEGCPNVTTIAMSQVGDWLGGKDSSVYRQQLTRKAMNSFLCKVDRPFTFVGRMNDDVNTYVTEGSRGKLFFTYKDLCLTQKDTQQNAGGLSDMYKQFGTYTKSFYSVMMAPSSVKIYEMGQTHRRIHHLIDWNVAVPKIISDKFKIKD